MSTKRCPSCGDEFIATVKTCPDCGADLMEAASSPSEGEDSGDGSTQPPGLARSRGVDDERGQVAYDLADWSEEQRRHLDQLLVDVPHAWQGTDLLAPAAAQDAVDSLVDRIDLEAELGLDPAADKLAYEVGDYTDEQLQDLIDSLAAEGIRHEYVADTDELIVHDEDEERVEAVFDRFDFPDALPIDDEDGEGGTADDGLVVQEVLGDLFVAADRLKGDGTDAEGLLGFFDAAQRLADLALPFGFAEKEWDGVKAEVAHLVELIETDETAEDDHVAVEIAAAADQVRTMLRRYV